ncbi:MAG: hypothetical protein WAT39_11640 [Planctomycetota bacterium]
MLDLHHDFTFNPDGSGRVTVRWTGPLAGAPAPADFLRAEIEGAQGVEAWADVDCAPVDDQMVFTGTAWFRDAAALRFHCQGFHFHLLDFRVEQHGDGSVTVATVEQPQPEPDAALPAGASRTEVAERLATERQKLAMARTFVTEMFGSLTCHLVLRLPGKLAGTVRGTRLADNAVQVDFDGARLVEVLERLLADDVLMLKLLRRGGITPSTAMELLGDQGPVKLRTGTATAPQFDYDAEVADAHARFAPFAAQVQAAVPQAGPAEPLANARIVATKIVHEADDERGLCPLGQSQPGITLTIAGDLAQAALELDQAAFERVVADGGIDFTPADEWDRRCHFPKATRDGRTVLLEMSFVPPPGARGLQELTGRVVAVCSDGSEEHDLGFAELRSGVAGDFAGARLLRCEPEDEQHQAFEVLVHLPRERVLGCALAAGDERWPLQQAGYSSCNDECTFTWRLEGELPRGARMVMTVASGLSRVPYDFSLAQVDWLGNPL